MATEIRDVFLELWPRFEAYGIRAAVPRNYSGLPDRIRGDLDVLVHPADMGRAGALMREAARSGGWARLYEDLTCNHHQTIFWRAGAEGQPPKTLHFDLQDALGRKGFRYCRVEPFLDNPVRFNGFRVLRPPGEVVALALHSLLDKKTVREDYRATLQTADEDVERFAIEVLPSSAADDLCRWLRAGAPEEEVAAVSTGLRRSLRMAYPPNLVRPALVKLRRALAYFGRRRGVLIAFLGPDGAGKSTILEATLEMSPTGPFPVRAAYLGKRDPFLPTSHLIRFIYRRKDRRGTGRSSSRSRPARGLMYRLKDALGLLNWVFEQWARYLIHVRPYLQQGGVVLTDRYAFDLGNREDESWAHHPLFLRMLPRLFPVPDRTYLLWEEPDILYARKKELEPEQGAAFLRRFRRIVDHVPRSREVRTNEPIPVIASRIAHEIASAMEARCRP